LGGEDALAATDALLEAVQKGSVGLRRQATLALKNVGPAALAAPGKQGAALAEKVTPVLAKALIDADEETRMNAAVACIGWKSLALPLTPDLLRALEDKKEARRVRAQAGVALSRVFKDINLGPAEEKAMEAILRVVGDQDDVGLVRERALWPVRVYLNKTDKPALVFKALTAILDEPPAVPTKMLRYDCAYLLGMFQGPAAPEKALDVLLTVLKDPEIKLYAGGAGGPAGRREGDQPGGKGFEEKGVDDGRIMAVDALAKIGAARVVGRPEIVAQLRALHSDPKTLFNLAKGLKEFLPEVERVLKGKK
jgi:HEAT repeat protein